MIKIGLVIKIADQILARRLIMIDPKIAIGLHIIVVNVVENQGFGGFLISTALWFLALLLPCGRRALQGATLFAVCTASAWLMADVKHHCPGKKIEVKEDSVSRYPSKEAPVGPQEAGI